jgi:hypothetical protein
VFVPARFARPCLLSPGQLDRSSSRPVRRLSPRRDGLGRIPLFIVHLLVSAMFRSDPLSAARTGEISDRGVTRRDPTEKTDLSSPESPERHATARRNAPQRKDAHSHNQPAATAIPAAERAE